MRGGESLCVSIVVVFPVPFWSDLFPLFVKDRFNHYSCSISSHSLHHLCLCYLRTAAFLLLSSRWRVKGKKKWWLRDNSIVFFLFFFFSLLAAASSLSFTFSVFFFLYYYLLFTKHLPTTTRISVSQWAWHLILPLFSHRPERRFSVIISCKLVCLYWAPSAGWILYHVVLGYF